MKESFCGTGFYVECDYYIRLNMESNCTEHRHAHTRTHKGVHVKTGKTEHKFIT